MAASDQPVQVYGPPKPFALRVRDINEALTRIEEIVSRYRVGENLTEIKTKESPE